MGPLCGYDIKVFRYVFSILFENTGKEGLSQALSFTNNEASLARRAARQRGSFSSPVLGVWLGCVMEQHFG